ncbi:sialate O-acetylesterase [Mesorhizobium sp. M0955]|uniref:sialate O-acetylesterase n=1 Tax=Mesorhizobium sp. M0955 TaxID=2957033 RepID=UPI00333D1E7A
MTSIKIDMKDGLSSGTAIKGPARCATTVNITLSGEQTIDGVAVVAGDRVLVKNQITASENGVFICDSGPWRRARDFNKTRDVATGTMVLITSGTTNAGSWYISSAEPIVVGTTPINFAFSFDQAGVDAIIQEARDSRDAAEGFADDAEADVLQTHADVILTHADVVTTATNVALAQAAIGATIYDTMAVGIAATTNGQFFIVKGDGTNTYALMYKNVAGVATFVSDYQSVTGSRHERGVTSVLSLTCDMYPASVSGVLDSNSALRFVDALGPALIRAVVPADITTAVGTAVSGIDASFGVTSRISITCDMYPVTVRGVLDTNNALRYVDAVSPALADPGGDDDVAVAPTQFYVFLIAGQSNAVGQGDSGPTIPSGVAKQYYSSALTNIVSDPVGNASTGSAWPAFAKKFFELTGCGVIFVPTAVSGSAQAAAADRGSGHWDVGGTLYGASVIALNAALVAVEAASLAWQLGGILWVQGEADAIQITSAITTDSVYYSALDAMLTRFETDTGGGFVPFLMAMTGQQNTSDPSGWPLVRAKQRVFVKSRDNAFLAFTGAKNFAARGLMKDTYHYFQAAYDEMGEAMAVVAAAVCLGRA